MKNCIKILLLFVTINNAQAQQISDLKDFYTDFQPTGDVFIAKYYKDINNNFTPFIGDWMYQNGDTTFIVTLWKETKVGYPKYEDKYFKDEIRGHYKLVKNYGLPSETIVYTSRINIGASNNPWQCSIYGNSTSPNRFSALIYDLSRPLNLDYPLGVRGNLIMVINPGTAPLTATWKITLPEGIRGTDEPITFLIPNNITLTKM